MSAPVCHISPDQTIENQRQKQRNGKATVLPTIPHATDLASALIAIQRLTQIVNQLTGALNSVVGSQTNDRSERTGPQGPAGKPGQPPKPPRWSEVSRATEKVRVYNPTDRQQYVDIERINGFVMRDAVTGNTWEWKR